ncbi:MAG: hypothetical protein NTV70_05895 [Acidobacteria bacterium]|nr:hypothetical protein [Acidobacteriota bacterium]
MDHRIEVVADVDPKRWADWLAKGKQIDRRAVQRTLGLALAVLVAAAGTGAYILMVR